MRLLGKIDLLRICILLIKKVEKIKLEWGVLLLSKKDLSQYNEHDIKTYSDCAGIRKRPTMYIQELGPGGVKRLMIEGFANALDEFQAGYGKKITINIDQKTSEIQIEDDGRGIPVGKLVDIMTKVHTGGKFDDNSYNYSIGMNGVGLKAINALSTSTVVNIRRDGKKYVQEFSKGETKSKLQEIKNGKVNDTGTKVTFIPDKEIFEDISINLQEYQDFYEKISYLNKGLIIDFVAVNDKGNPVKKTFHSKNGILDYLDKIEKTPAFKPMVFNFKNDTMECELAFTYSPNNEKENLISFVNGIETSEHGTHVQGFHMVLTQVIKDYIKNSNLFPKTKTKLEITGDDVCECLSGILSIRDANPLFDSQTKNKYTSSKAIGFFRKYFMSALKDWLEKNTKESKVLCTLVINTIEGRLAAQRAKNLKKKSTSPFDSLSSISKLTPCSSNVIEEKELFLTEGNSAGGSATDGRNPKTQAIYKLRGKVLNVFGKKELDSMKNKEIKDVVNVIGCGIGKEYNPDNCQYGKIIFMCDADVDGSHIVCLLTTLFHSYMPGLIERGKVFVAQPPLYKIQEGKNNIIYLQDKAEFSKYLAEKLLDKYELGIITKEKKLAKLKKEEIIKLLSVIKDYLFNLNKISYDYCISQDLMEDIILLYSKDEDKFVKNLTKKYKELFLMKNKKVLTIEGMHNNAFHTLKFTKSFIVDIFKIRKLIKEVPTKIQIKGKKEEKYKSYSLFNFNKKILEGIYRLVNIMKLKGLGELDPEELKKTTMDISSRKLIKLNIDNLKKVNESFNTIMGKDADLRKEFLDNFNIDPELIDS